MLNECLKRFSHKKFDKFMGECYIPRITSIKLYYRIVWVTQKNIEVEENRALKKEELKEKIRKNSLLTFIISQ